MRLLLVLFRFDLCLKIDGKPFVLIFAYSYVKNPSQKLPNTRVQWGTWQQQPQQQQFVIITEESNNKDTDDGRDNDINLQYDRNIR